MAFSPTFAAQGIIPIKAKVNFVESNEAKISANNNANINAYSNTNANINSNANGNLMLNGALSTQEKTKIENEPNNNNDKNDKNQNAVVNVNEESGSDSSLHVSDVHKSTVAIFVKNLLAVADRDNGIGAKVRLIARAQNDSEKTTTEAIKGVENYGDWKTFFIGTDYKNIGVLRSQMVVTASHIDQLKRLADQTTSAEVKADLEAQIKVLERDQAVIDAFIKLNESKFSLFGWLFR